MTVGGMVVVVLFAIGLAITFMTARLAERSYTARGVALRLVAALFFTVPVCVAGARLVDGNVSDAFLYAFLAVSFMLAVPLQWIIERGFRRRLVRRRTYAPSIWQSESLASKETRLATPWVTVGRPPLDPSSRSPVSPESEDIVSNEIRQEALQVPAERTPPMDQRSEVQGTALVIPRLREEAKEELREELREEPKEEPKEELEEEPKEDLKEEPKEEPKEPISRNDALNRALRKLQKEEAREEPKEEPISRGDALNRALRKLQNDSPGVVASALISEDGLMIASVLAPHMEETRVAGMTATLLNLGSRAAIELKRGGVHEVIVRGDQGYAVLINASSGTLLLALTDESAKLGLVFIDMRKAVQTVAKVL